MRIVQVMVNKAFGGAERVFVDTCIALAEQGHEVLAVTDAKARSLAYLPSHPRLTIAAIRMWGRNDLFARRVAGKSIAAFRPDVVHAHLRRGLTLINKIPNRCQVPLVVSVHNYDHLSAYERANTLIALTEAHQDAIAQSTRCQQGDVFVLSNFSRIPPIERAPAQRKDQLRFVAFGRFVEKKGFALLIEAFGQVVRQFPQATLTLAGRGDLEHALKEQAGACPSITLRDWVTDIGAILDQHDLFVLPSLSEPFGIVLIEAMARGKAIVSTRTEGPKEFLNEDIAFLCEVGSVAALTEALLNACGDPGLRQAKANAARETYQTRFYQDAIIPELVQIYEKSIARYSAQCSCTQGHGK